MSAMIETDCVDVGGFSVSNSGFKAVAMVSSSLLRKNQVSKHPQKRVSQSASL